MNVSAQQPGDGEESSDSAESAEGPSPDDAQFIPVEVPDEPGSRVVKAEPIPPTHEDKTRRLLAVVLIGILAVLVGVGAWGWGYLVIHDGGEATRAQLQSYGALFAPVVTLVGTILGFYFSSHDRHR